MSKGTFLHAKRSLCLSSSSVFGAGSLHVVWSTIIQMVSRGYTSREFASRSPFAIKFANPSDTMSACAPPFSLEGLVCSKLRYCKVEFLYLSVLEQLLRIYLQLF